MMEYTAQEVIRFVGENDVKFIRLTFCDIFGTQKNISIMPDELSRAFESGISFDASAVRGFMNVEESDLMLFPDPGTLMILPWRPQHGRVARLFCDIRHPDGRAFEGDGRSILRRVLAKAASMGLECKVGAECEFYLFEVDERGMPTQRTHDQAGYCDIAPLDKGENVRREICLTLEEMDILPESSHHEQGPGQNEIDFRYDEALRSADNLVTFKSVVKTIAAKNGLFASFMPKPLEGKMGSGLHINLSLFRDGRNLFDPQGGEPAPESRSFIAGVMHRIREITLLLNPTTNSYARFGGFEAPGFVTWSHQNRSQLVRIPAAVGPQSRMEVRSPDPMCNPYLAFALLISAGLEGVEQGMELCPPSNFNLYQAQPQQLESIQHLPKDMSEAIELASASEFLTSVLPAKTVEKFIAQKKLEWESFDQAGRTAEAERELYFYQS